MKRGGCWFQGCLTNCIDLPRIPRHKRENKIDARQKSAFIFLIKLILENLHNTCIQGGFPMLSFQIRPTLVHTDQHTPTPVRVSLQSSWCGETERHASCGQTGPEDRARGWPHMGSLFSKLLRRPEERGQECDIMELPSRRETSGVGIGHFPLAVRGQRQCK